ncbi:PAS domain-containing sensor histidine kinase [Deminuibacter soli]|uniref:histidine kinase n=1 Tax=Deminuibacter soli TaxID=2291815 RepID=A0A3E1NL28_9BACT|nr:PAS domain-containing sensor histidine kinase [Deminuibacter soli]RFM28622.1 PAS domain S-box protein [Deminuibacter soli]
MDNASSTGIQYLKFLFDNDGQADSLRQKLVDFFPALVYVYDTDKKQISYINKKLTDLLGYSFEDIQNWDNDFLKLIFNEDIEAVKSALDKFDELPGETDFYGFDCRFNHKGGDWRYFHAQGVILQKNDKGKPSSLLFVAQDITESCKSRDEIKAMKELMRDNEHMLQFGSWSWNLENNTLDWSDGIYDILGYSREDNEVQKTLAFVKSQIAPKDLQGLKQTINGAIQEHTKFQHQFAIKRKDGKEIVLLTTGKILTNADGKAIKVYGTSRDITEQASFNEALLHFKSTQLERESFLTFGTWESGADASNFIASDGLLQLYGYNPSERAQLAITEAFFNKHLSAEDLAKLKQAREDALSSNDVYVVEYAITTASGEEKKLESFAKIIRNENNEPVKTYGTTRDITLLKNYEQSLESKIRELNRSNKDLEEFAYVASHDLQEPLRKLTTFCERLSSKYAAELTTDMRLYVERIVSSADNMRILIDNLLEFSRVTRSANQLEPTDLNAIIKEVKQDLDFRIEETSTTIVIEQPLPQIEGIHSQIRQLFTNLLSNSIKFRTLGVQTVIHIESGTATKEDKEICHLPTSKNYHRIEVRDNGIGFEQEYAERIFQIFQRLHGKVEYPGSGVGLAICRKIAENHHGKIYARSTPGQGASFIILLPK